jgi:hypothetical protein
VPSRQPLALFLVPPAAVGAASLWLLLVVGAALGGGGGGGGCEAGGEVVWRQVAATTYETGSVGAYGVPLANRLAFAELGLHGPNDRNDADANRLGEALGLGGPLPPLAKVLLKAPNGRIVVAEKLDVGVGGPPIDGLERAIDLWRATRIALGLPADWAGLLSVALPSAPKAACLGGGGGLGERIVEIARSQLGVTERPLGSGCNPYGPCESWCSLFASWVWHQAGVAVGAVPFSGALYSWAAVHTHIYPPTAVPQPGWTVFFGSGPQTPATSLHVAIVERVAGGEVTLINGAYAGRVERSGPCPPSQAERLCGEPGPIYGYAEP